MDHSARECHREQKAAGGKHWNAGSLGHHFYIFLFYVNQLATEADTNKYRYRARCTVYT